AQAGMQVPAHKESVFPIFQDVFADIGDEQSIEQSLSTFSSHMRNIIDVLAHARPNTLVLLDELSAGTDPAEGSALARAILADLLEHGVSAIVTTHHSDLKAYAHNTPGLRNASVEFDNQTLSPTYRLSIGIPGRSNAIAIAERIGLPAHLVEAARALLLPQDIQVDALLNELQRERDAAAAEHRRAEHARIKAEAAQRRLDERLARFDAEEEERREAARRNLAHDIDVLKQDLERAQREIERAEREGLRDRLVAASQAVQAGETRLETKRWRPRRRTRQPDQAPLVLTPGSRARLRGLGQEVEVGSGPDGGEVEVQMGAFRAKVKVDQLEAPEKAAGAAVERSPVSWSYSAGPAVTIDPELHLRGIRVEDALPMLEGYLDQAFRIGLPFARIIHGKGTGVMRRVVREMLAASPLVRSYESAPPEQGGEGVTVATLAV
ncbi:MAG: Smr/MutS family protein, partial [Chloroflexota bacterium]